MLIALLTKHPNLWQAAEQLLPPDQFLTSFNRRVYQFILEEYRASPDAQTPVYAKAFDEKEMARISYFVNTAMLNGDPMEQLRECVAIIKDEQAKKIDPGAFSPEELMQKLKGEN